MPEDDASFFTASPTLFSTVFGAGVPPADVEEAFFARAAFGVFLTDCRGSGLLLIEEREDYRGRTGRCTANAMETSLC